MSSSKQCLSELVKVSAVPSKVSSKALKVVPKGSDIFKGIRSESPGGLSWRCWKGPAVRDWHVKKQVFVAVHQEALGAFLERRLPQYSLVRRVTA